MRNTLTARDTPLTNPLTAGVEQIRARLAADVCSIYLLEADRTHLILTATIGLKPDSVGKVRMSLDEGLAGLAAETLKPVVVPNVKQHPRFKWFSVTGEDPYHGFLAVPLVREERLVGVLTAQTLEARSFSQREVTTLIEAADDISAIVAEARERSHFLTPLHGRLWELARNLWWSWDVGSTSLFRDLDPERWQALDRNPVALLSEIPLAELEQRIHEGGLASRINHTYRRLREYLEDGSTWGATHTGLLRAHPVAYLSAEFGIHESLPIYSGGLGVLAGDHMKSASDLDVPLVGVGLFYGQGYFRQRLDAHGWQQEHYAKVDLTKLPLEPAIGRDGQPVRLELSTRKGALCAHVWEAAIGRRRLLLLDSDVVENTPDDRRLTARLYGGDVRTRIRQELLLGVGGIRTLFALGITPGVVHLNEGHSAFAILELIRHRMEREGLDFDKAARQVARRTVFTTHTPVPAGHDRFPNALVDEHLGALRDQLGISHERLMGLGRVDPDDQDEPLCMTVLGLKVARRANAVSSLHAEVTRQMWGRLWGTRPEEKVPIGHITNGIHIPSWLAPQMRQLYDRHLPADWGRRTGTPAVWKAIDGISDGTLWETHVALKIRLTEFVRARIVREATRRGETADVVDRVSHALSPDALTIGFARRFATYKRAALFLRDPDRLSRLVNDPQRPIQFVFAGKGHPRDEPAKRVIQEIHQLTRDPRFVGKIVLVEDYDIDLGRHLVQGVDLWLNNPRRPEEASGTSGQKVPLNGGLNLSVLDGWWAEAYDGMNGFAIGTGETHESSEVHDERDAEALMTALIEQVIPLYYDRDSDGVPRGWTKRMKHGIRTLGWRFSADRMVKDYVSLCYVPAAGGRSSEMENG
ncbi:MAG: alpha-glucan family phosphorylase [Acidobacteriota bacterium]|nr:alpha-glucan family phosphorylase [Acidobacteriota bacterium]